jgi:hypothetical protein
MKYILDRTDVGFWLIRESEGQKNAYPASYSKTKAKRLINKLNNDSLKIEGATQNWTDETISIQQNVRRFAAIIEKNFPELDFDTGALKSSCERAILQSIKQE